MCRHFYASSLQTTSACSGVGAISSFIYVTHSILISDAAVADVPPTWDGAEVVSRW